MKKTISAVLLITLLLSLCAMAACGLPHGDGSSAPNSEKDLTVYTPDAMDDRTYAEDETYYTSASLDLVTEVHGNYSTGRPFTLDKEDRNKRIYHEIYFYEEDYLLLLYYKNKNALGRVYAALTDAEDAAFAETAYGENGDAYQIDIKKAGVYDVVVDVTTYGIDLVFLREIETPVYEIAKTCELYCLTDDGMTYTPMTYDAATGLWSLETDLPLRSSIGFVSASHNAHYQTTVEEAIADRLLYWDHVITSQLQVNVGGRYKITFHAKTYVVNAELLAPDTASYFCQVGWNQNKELQPADPAAPYLFTYTFTAVSEPNAPYVELPSFYPTLGMPYRLDVIDEHDLTYADRWVKQAGVYRLTVDLKHFTLTVESTAE